MMANLISKINQGRFDSEKELLNLRNNAMKKNNKDVLDSVNQRLKKVYPHLYQRFVGPLNVRKRDKKFNCYCNIPKSHEKICDDILADNVPYDALMCDDCWQEDISPTWGYYGWAAKIISEDVWKQLCWERANDKFVE